MSCVVCLCVCGGGGGGGEGSGWVSVTAVRSGAQISILSFVCEEELSVEIGELSGVHVYHMNMSEPQQCLYVYCSGPVEGQSAITTERVKHKEK